MPYLRSDMESTRAFLDNLLARYDWTSNFSHSPEFTRLMTTNEVPTHFQAGQLDASIQGLDPLIREIQAEIDLLHHAAASLESRMLRLSKIKHDYEGALSSVRRLPAEIVVEILDWTVERRTSRSYHISGFDVFNLSDGPWYLGQVCTAWRSTVERHCPHLWSRLTINVPPKLEDSGVGVTIPIFKRNMVALLERALERSGRSRLDFSFRHIKCIRMLAQFSEAETEVISKCFNLLLTHSMRWGSVELTIPWPLLSRISDVHGRVNKLEDAYLKCQGPAKLDVINAFEFAPKLKTLHLIDLHPEAIVLFPLGTIATFLDKRALSSTDRADTYLDIIVSGSNLCSFSYHHHSPIPESVGSQLPIVRNTSIQSLSASLGNFLSSLDLPALTSMTVTSGCDIPEYYDVIPCPDDALLGLHALISHSSCSLTVLHLVDVPIIDNRLLSILQLTPQLRTFTIEYHFYTSPASIRDDEALGHLFHQMAETQVVGKNRNHVLVPSLKKLAIITCEVDCISVGFLRDEFVDMINSRRMFGRSSAFECLYIRISGRGWDLPFFRSGGLETLEALEDDGLHVTVTFDDVKDNTHHGDEGDISDSDSDYVDS
ncbi:hypothetical protein EV421DRAFT_147831 [Armillaria borealis]|uniref:F-box domain-containing protein n=1 Tax=Armillaria borealis TaxID=47425 RepID=A0AA39JVX9_9AGAR|nr:hypothetical protein EV421DRAFT_147831 [Armillaria borealis]